jgi:Cop9 signalosome subunit 5 C-terminal domain
MSSCWSSFGRSTGFVKLTQVSTLSSSDLITNWEYTADQVTDLAQKIEKADPMSLRDFGFSSAVKKDNPITKLAADGYIVLTPVQR